MFERFSERARLVIVRAQEEAVRLRHNYIGTEHLLLGLLREDEGLAARVLASLGVGLEGVRTRVEEIVGRGDEVTGGEIPFTPRAKKILEHSLREAKSLNHPYIRTEHILLGLVAEGEGVANRIMDAAGATGGRIRAEVERQLSGRAGGWPAEEPSAPGREPVEARSAVLVLNDPLSDRRSWVMPAIVAAAAAFAAGLLVGWAIWA